MGEVVEALRQLAAEAAKEARKDEVRTCWPWQHRWKAWQTREIAGFVRQQRVCGCCNKMQDRVVSGCAHEWKQKASFKLHDGERVTGREVQYVCQKCGNWKSETTNA